MKNLFLLAFLMSSLASFAGTKAEVIFEQTTHGRAVAFKTKKKTYYAYARYDIRDNELFFINGNEKIVIAKLADDFSFIENEAKITVHVSKNKKEFKFWDSYSFGPYPNPRREERFHQLMEVETFEGEILCFNLNELDDKPNVFRGACR